MCYLVRYYNIYTLVRVIGIAGIIMFIPIFKFENLASSVVVSKTFTFLYAMLSIFTFLLIWNGLNNNKAKWLEKFQLSIVDILLLLLIVYILINRYFST